MKPITKYLLAFIIALLIPAVVIMVYAPAFGVIVIGAALLAYILSPFTDWLAGKCCNRSFQAFLLTFIIPSLLFAIVIWKVPSVVNGLLNAAQAFPAAYDAQLAPLLDKLAGIKLSWQQIANYFSGHTPSGDSFALFSKGIGNAASWTINVLLFMVIAFLLLRDWPQLVETARRTLHSLTPDPWNPQIDDLMDSIGSSISRLIRGQLKVSSILAVYYGLTFHTIGMLAAGEFHFISSWMLLGIVTGYLNLLPYIGVPLGGVMAVILGVVEFQLEPLWIYLALPVTVIAGVTVDHKLLTPVTIGHTVKVYELFVYLAIYLGGAIGGLVGITLALPAMVIINELIIHFYRHWLEHRRAERAGTQTTTT